jgi:hypothetical protein
LENCSHIVMANRKKSLHTPVAKIAVGNGCFKFQILN